MKIEIYPEKAQYITNEQIKLMVEIEEELPLTRRGILRITHLQEQIHAEEYDLPDAVNEIQIDGMDTRFGGYGVELSVIADGQEYEKCYTAFDVVEDSTKAIRYGFLSDFHTEDGDSEGDVSNLRKFHINMVQYYDWSYRHDNMVSSQQKYTDMMGRVVDLDTVFKKISACRRYGMKSLGYGAVYAASKDYYEEHKENALYTSADEPLVFIDTFYIMNVARDCNWRKHIIEEYAKAVGVIGFDGIHMDTYGFPKTAYNEQKRRLIHLEEEYPSLIEDTKTRLNEITAYNHLIFNNVGNWPVKTVAKSPQDAIYIEVWKPYTTYRHIKQIILDARRECEDRKPVILAAYLKPFRTEGEGKAANASYLLTAVITVNGAYHLLLGEENAVLTQGYYVDHSFLSKDVSEKLRSYYDFLVQYMELFYDHDLKDVSMTHIGWDNTEYYCFDNQWSVDGEKDKLWLTVREKEDRKLISLINLCGNHNEEWNVGKNKPDTIRDIKLQVQIDKQVKGIYFISPDVDHGKAQSIEYTTIKTDRGYAIQFIVPSLEYWSNVWIEF